MSPKQKPTRPVDIYVRVSHVGARKGESFISPDEQEKRCRAQLEADGLKIGKVYKDLDQPGGTQDRPALNQVMQRIRDGVSGGVVVAKLNRFGRTTRGVLDDIAEIESHGAVLISVEEKFDTSTSTGRLVLRLFASISELELDRIREGWEVAHSRMLERGIQVGRAPLGYEKGPDKRLVPSEYADLVREAFRLRAHENLNWYQLARWMTDAGLPTQKGQPWRAAAARTLIGNVAYLGKIRHGETVIEGAHEPLVDERTFRLANRKAENSFTGDRGDGPLLGGGLVRCGVCGRGMVRAVSTARDGRYEYLRCPSSGGGHPTIAITVIQPYVIREALERMELTEGVYVEAIVDPELQAKLSAVLADIAELDRQLEDGEIPPTVYSKAAAVAERDKVALEAEIEAQGSTGQIVQINGKAEHDREAARQLLLTLIQPEAAEHAAKVEPGQIPNARRLLKETLGKVVVHKGRAPVKERVTIELA